MIQSKLSFNTLNEFEFILKQELGMLDWHLVYDENEQPIYLMVDCDNHKSRKAKVAPGNNHGHQQFKFTIRENGIRRTICFSVHRVVYLLDNPTENISGLVIDHKDNNPKNNTPWNLQAVSQRLNTTKDKAPVKPIPTKHTVDYCQQMLDKCEKEYSTYLATHPDESHAVSKNPEVARLTSKLSQWKRKLAYASLHNQFELVDQDAYESCC